MSATAVKELVRRFYSEMFRNLSLAEEFIGANYVDHNNEQGGRGLEVFRSHIEALRRTFPDFSVNIEDMLAEGDKVVTRVTGRGTHTGLWMQIEPTGSVVEVKGINIDRIADGRIVEHWGEADTVAMLVQMGVDPFAGRKNKGTPSPK